MTVDRSLNAVYAPIRWDLPLAVQQFQNLLAGLSKTALCDQPWQVETPRASGDGSVLDGLGDVDALVAWFAEREALVFGDTPRVGPRTLYASGGGADAARYKAQLCWDA